MSKYDNDIRITGLNVLLCFCYSGENDCYFSFTTEHIHSDRLELIEDIIFKTWILGKNILFAELCNSQQF